MSSARAMAPRTSSKLSRLISPPGQSSACSLPVDLLETVCKGAQHSMKSCSFLFRRGSESLGNALGSEVAADLSRRLSGIFLNDNQGSRPVYSRVERFRSDPHWKDLVLFYEYLHGEDGSGMGASHQPGWTAPDAKVLQQSGTAEDSETNDKPSEEVLFATDIAGAEVSETPMLPG